MAWRLGAYADLGCSRAPEASDVLPAAGIVQFTIAAPVWSSARRST